MKLLPFERCVDLVELRSGFRLLPESSGLLAVLVVAQSKVRILSLYFSEERSLDEVRDGCVGFPCLLLSWLRTVYAICVIAAFHMFICLRAAIPHSHLPAGIVATMRRVVNYHSSWARQQQVELLYASGKWE
ncbi:LOB domain-containing protein 36-like [Dorcoceras hygrometricum]|uniref:LOB domain-containing protein 36-like n=1 Tax=Dorcoceras hygrometricum TaxID=472368 RepID=A0A2Z6ZVK2_9LAMI|nr:LOB domain-containing protein 36-like [Dorcoceras hygrometricum]